MKIENKIILPYLKIVLNKNLKKAGKAKEKKQNENKKNHSA